MQLKSVLLSLVAATTVIAMPTPDDHDTIPELQGWKPWSCLTDYQAVAIVNIFIQSEQTNGNETTTYDSLIESIANSDDQEISDSVNFFTGTPYGSVTRPNLATIEARHTVSGNGVYQITTLNIWHTCNGINVFVLGNDGKIDQTYIEFNSAVWAQDLGFTVKAPPGFVGKK